MGSLLSSLTSGVITPLIRAGLVPAAVFSLLLLLFVVPLTPESLAFFERLGPVSTEWEFAAVSFFTIVLAGLLYALSDPVIRFCEGYPWKEGLLGRLLTYFNKREFRRIQTTLGGLSALRDRDLDDATERALRLEINPTVSELKRELRYRFPDKESLILPTRLGNTIRSFERYPWVEYRMDAVVLWAHLQSVIEPSFGAKADKARSNLSFLLNMAFLLATLSGVLLLLSVTSRAATVENTVAPAALFALGSLFLYRAAIGAASTWGVLVRAAFDLYRPKLLEKLGYGAPPATRTSERALWKDITNQLIYGDRDERPRMDPGPTPDVAPKRLTKSSGVCPLTEPRMFEVVVRLTNQGGAASEAPISITETPPTGFAYVWGSVTSDKGSVSVDGVGPYTFSVEQDMQSGADLTFRYKILDLRSSP